MVRKLTDKELHELSESSKLKIDPETREVARFGELIEKLNEMIEQNSTRMAADQLRSQSQLEVLATLQKMIRAQTSKTFGTSSPIDLGPLRDVLTQIHEANAQREAISYTFDIQRSSEGGAMQRVVATPIQATKH